MTARTPSPLNLSHIKPSDPLWILNTTEGVIEDSKSRADVILSVRTSYGAEQAVNIPSTWIPIDLTLQANAVDLVACSALRSMISRKLLKLISEEEAVRMLSLPAAQREAETVAKKVAKTYDRAAALEAGTPANAPENDAPNPLTDNIGFDIISRLTAGTINIETAIKQMKAVLPVLENEQVDFLSRTKVPDELSQLLHDEMVKRGG